MRSTNRRPQQGSTLVEALIAGALLGVVGIVALTGWDTALMAAHEATHQAWARCVARSEMEAVLAAPYAGSYSSLQVTGAKITVDPSSGPDDTQVVTVAVGGTSSSPAYQLTALKASPMPVSNPNPGPISSGCPSP